MVLEFVATICPPSGRFVVRVVGVLPIPAARFSSSSVRPGGAGCQAGGAPGKDELQLGRWSNRRPRREGEAKLPLAPSKL